MQKIARFKSKPKCLNLNWIFIRVTRYRAICCGILRFKRNTRKCKAVTTAYRGAPDRFPFCSSSLPFPFFFSKCSTDKCFWSKALQCLENNYSLSLPCCIKMNHSEVFFFFFLNCCKIQKLHRNLEVKIIHFSFARLLPNKNIIRHKKSFSSLIFITQSTRVDILN